MSRIRTSCLIYQKTKVVLRKDRDMLTLSMWWQNGADCPFSHANSLVKSYVILENVYCRSLMWGIPSTYWTKKWTRTLKCFDMHYIGQFQITVFSRFSYVLLCNHEYFNSMNHRQAKDYITRCNKTERKLSFERRHYMFHQFGPVHLNVLSNTCILYHLGSGEYFFHYFICMLCSCLYVLGYLYSWCIFRSFSPYDVALWLVYF